MGSIKLGIPQDKTKHLIVFGMVGLWLIPYFGFAGWLAVLSGAVGKEIIWDKWLDKGTPEYLDVVASMEIPNLTMIFYFVIKYWDTIWQF